MPLGGHGLAEGKMSLAQRLVTRYVSPATAAKIEAESRTWMIKCPNCGYERSVWDAGGVPGKYVPRRAA